MYRKILVALENSHADETLVPHVRELALRLQSELLLLHVADGWAARHYDDLALAESAEIRADRAYLEKLAGELREAGLKVVTRLGMGNPPEEILNAAREQGCDLIAMTSHGHRFLSDLIHGSTIAEVRHKSVIPLLVLRAARL
jgi:nucleotide-binding universal stress UspA family protein